MGMMPLLGSSLCALSCSLYHSSFYGAWNDTWLLALPHALQVDIYGWCCSKLLCS